MDLRRISPSLQRLWADEVLYLHSLWHQAAPQNPNPIPNPRPDSNLRPVSSTEFKRKKRGRKGKKNKPADPPAPEIEWPVNPSPPRDAEPVGWPEPAKNPHQRAPPSAVDEAKANALRIQKNAMQSCLHFFSKDGSVDDDEMSEDENEEESTAFEFFLGVFSNDGELRGYYEKNNEKGEFLCLVCGGTGEKLGKTYGNCVGLVQHSNAISKTKRREAHRGFGRAVCRVLGWDIKRLPNIVLDLGLPLGQSLAKSAEMQDDVRNIEGNGDSADCVKATETETANEVMQKEEGAEVVGKPDAKCLEEGVNDGRNELLDELGDHPDGSENNKKKDSMEIILVSSPSNPSTVEISSPCGPIMNQGTDVNDWEDLTQASATTQPGQPPSTEEQARAIAAQAQQNGLKASRNFLARSDDSSSSDEDVDDDEEEVEKRESVAFKFFSKLFEMDRDLRNYYENNSLKGEFCCLVCGAIGKKTWKRFGDCHGLVQHSKSIVDTKRQWAHRAFGRAICHVLGWDVNVDPIIFLAPNESESPTFRNL